MGAGVRERAPPGGRGAQREVCCRCPGPARRDPLVPDGFPSRGSQASRRGGASLGDNGRSAPASYWRRWNVTEGVRHRRYLTHRTARSQSSCRGGRQQDHLAVRRIPSPSVWPVCHRRQASFFSTASSGEGGARLVFTTLTLFGAFSMRCRRGTSLTLLAGERLLPPPAGSDRPRRVVSWRQHPMGLRTRCFQTRRLPLAARSQPPGRGRRRARRRPKGVLPGPGASQAARPQGGQPGWAPAQGGGQTSRPVSRSPPGSPARTQPHLTAPGHLGLPQPQGCPLSAAAVSPTEHFSSGPGTCSPHSCQGRRSEPAGSALSAPLPGVGLPAGPPPAGPRRAAGLKVRPALADITPAPPRPESGGCAAAPMMPSGAHGRSNPSWPFYVDQEMAAPGVAVAPLPARAASSASPLLIAEALPALDRDDEMRTRQSSPPVAYPSVSVVFPGAVSRESCCRFACELLKHVLYQRHQLPLPYEQLAHFCWRAAQDGEVMKKPPSMDLASKKCQQVLVELEEMFHHLEIMFSLSLVPRVLILLGGNVMSPRELYELNLEGICEGSAEESLKTGSCVRKLFHSLFVADVFSELKALPVMGTIVMVQGHRDCGIDWFRPKLNYKVPTRGRKLTVNVSCDGVVNVNASARQLATSAWEDYVWFQAPVALKGFHE